MSDQAPEQREAALKLAKRCLTDPEKCSMCGGFSRNDLADSLLDLHAGNVRLREALKDISLIAHGNLIQDGGKFVASICRAALSGSPATEGTKCAMCGDTKRIKATDGIAEFMVPCPDCWRPKLRRAPQPSLPSQAAAAGEAKEGE